MTVLILKCAFYKNPCNCSLVTVFNPTETQLECLRTSDGKGLCCCVCVCAHTHQRTTSLMWNVQRSSSMTPQVPHGGPAVWTRFSRAHECCFSVSVLETATLHCFVFVFFNVCIQYFLVISIEILNKYIQRLHLCKVSLLLT